MLNRRLLAIAIGGVLLLLGLRYGPWREKFDIQEIHGTAIMDTPFSAPPEAGPCQPASGLTITIRRKTNHMLAGSTLTDQLGNYKILLQPGQYLVHINAGTWGPAMENDIEVNLTSNQKARVDFFVRGPVD